MFQVLTNKKLVASVATLVAVGFMLLTVPAHAEGTPTVAKSEAGAPGRAPAPDLKSTPASPAGGNAPSTPATPTATKDSGTPTKMARKGKRKGKRSRKLAKARGKRKFAKRARGKRRVRTAQASTATATRH